MIQLPREQPTLWYPGLMKDIGGDVRLACWRFGTGFGPLEQP